jgi:hypothetical protein
MGFSGALLAMSAVQGISAIGQGYAQGAEDKYNAQIATNQASAIQVQGQIQQGQLTRQGGQMMARFQAVAGAAGLEPTGSVAAVELNNQTQIETDKAIAQYNTTMGMNSATDRAKMLKQQASQDVTSGYTNAFSDMLKGVLNYAMYNLKAPNSINTSGAPVYGGS